jgi:dihydrofolate reductase
MGQLIVIQFVSLDGIVTDPDGSGGTPAGGWAFRHGPQTVAGDKFRLGPVLDHGALLLGRVTWQLFATLWPNRTDAFSVKMNAIPKLVASRSHPDLAAWANSAPIEGDLVEAARTYLTDRDLVVTGSLSVVRALQDADLVDEYRLLTFPSIIKTGERLFPAHGAPEHLTCHAAERVGAAVLSTCRR